MQYVIKNCLLGSRVDLLNLSRVFQFKCFSRIVGNRLGEDDGMGRGTGKARGASSVTYKNNFSSS